MRDLLQQATEAAADYLDHLPTRPVAPPAEAVAAVQNLGGPLPADGAPPEQVLADLQQFGAPATIASAGPRYFGFVTGGVLPAALAANWLAAAWDQNCFSKISSPVGTAIENIALGWLKQVFGLPDRWGGTFVTGATMANFCGLAAARQKLLAGCGWNADRDGLFGAPPINVYVGAEAHASLFKALGLLGLGRERVIRVPADDQGRMRADALPALEAPAILCLQAGNVNSGAFDPLRPLIKAARQADAWIHIDGAFGLWAAASPALKALCDGADGADSWALDAHKWLNVPYDSGLGLVADPHWLQAAMAIQAAYLPDEQTREPLNFTPDSSRRMRGMEVWAALKSLGASGVQELIERNCRQAKLLAARLADAGFEVLNDVVLNQILVSVGDDDQTGQVMEAVQADGTCWFGGSQWQGRSVMRISISSWATTDADIEQSAAAIAEAARRVTYGMAKST